MYRMETMVLSEAHGPEGGYLLPNRESAASLTLLKSLKAKDQMISAAEVYQKLSY
jgi:hypothetical protein